MILGAGAVHCAVVAALAGGGVRLMLRWDWASLGVGVLFMLAGPATIMADRYD